MGRKADLKPGDVVGWLTLLTYRPGSVWLCHCKCGNFTTALTYRLLAGGKVSCGCMRQANKKTVSEYRARQRERYHEKKSGIPPRKTPKQQEVHKPIDVHDIWHRRK